MTTPDDTRFWQDHGIDEDVRDRRPYERWRAGLEGSEYKEDLRPIREAYPTSVFSSGQRAFLTRVAHQSDGSLIHRHPPGGYIFGNYDHIYPELRPDNAVVTTIRKHWHGEGEPPADLPPWQLYRHERMGKHIARVKDDDPDYGDHFGKNTEEVHKHAHKAKYLFPPSGSYEVVYTHDHSGAAAELAKANLTAGRMWKRICRGDNLAAAFFGDYIGERMQTNKSAQWLAAHLNKKHKGEGPEQLAQALLKPHWHAKKKKSKQQNYAARIDMHPMALEKFAGAEVVYFCIEGCIKADAILSAGGAVLSVPSVTLWDTPELEDPAFRERFLAGKTIVIVPDADWHKNSRVIMQARFLQTALAYHGLTAIVAAPPEEVYEANPQIKGVDDFLGLYDGKLENLEVVENIVPMERIHDLVAELHLAHSRPRADAIARDTAVLMALVAHANDGKISAPYSTIARIVGLQGRVPRWPRLPRYSPLHDPDEVKKHTDKAAKRVKCAIESLTSLGILSVEKCDFGVEVNPYSYVMDWVERPTITIAPEFRGKIHKQRLGSYASRTLEAAA
jgi:hypothetical protein